MVEYTYPHIKRKVKKLDKELEVNELAIHFQTQFDEGEDNISFKDAYEMAYNEILYSHIVLS
tara:strand:- start:156 stop:341 length:186 start_codon:yes stop_codon:yes gene_type:complete